VPVDLDFPDTRRRLRWLADEIAAIERMLEPAGGAQAGTTTVYLLDQHCREHDQTSHLLRFYERQHNGTSFTKIQWSLFLVSVAVASTLLVLFIAERLLP
jgi:hypothetical protein